MIHILVLILGLLFLAVMIAPKFVPTFIPTVIDTTQHMQDSTTVSTGGTGSGYGGTGLDLGSGYAPGGIGQPVSAVVNITAIYVTSNDETYTFTLQESSDDGTFTDCGIPTVLKASAGTALVGSYAVYGLVSQRYVRVHMVSTGTTPSVTYSTDFGVVGVGA